MTLETQYRNFLRNNRGGFCSFEEWKKINARLIKQALINIMKDDEELGLYDEPKPFKDMLSTTEDKWNEFKHSPFPSKKEPFKHKVEIIPADEILANRSNAYEFIDFDKQETLEDDFKVWDELFGILAWKFTPTKSGDMFLDAEKVFEELKDKFELKKK